MKDRILVVEDEIVLRDTLVYNLEHQGFIVEAVGDGNAAVQAARRSKPDLIILDIMLPFMDGFDVCRIIRQDMNMPIVFMTALDEEIDRVIGLEIGGDDYVIKPFSMRELVARVKARLRMTRLIREQTSSVNPVEETASEIKTFGNLTINEKRREILVNGKVLILKPREYELLLFFTKHTGRMVSRDYILKNVWGFSYIGNSRTVDVHVRWLREKIEEDPSHPLRVITVRGGGYRFEG